MGLGLCVPGSAFTQDDPASSRPRPGDVLVRVGDPMATPLKPADIVVGKTQVMAWPMDPAAKTVRSASRLNMVIVLRLPDDQLAPATKARAAEGVVAYTAICTHTGCEVEEWLGQEQLLYCPCHASKFDPKDGARVVDGPAPRVLPALPLRIAEGVIVVAEPYTARVGFEAL